MKCPVCENTMGKGKTTITLDKGINETIVIKEVPGMICKQKSGLKMGFLIYQPAA
jgi:YgiT-type zinc finger domain-containing protein